MMYREYLSRALNVDMDSLKDELRLKLILKARLTKKELKILNGSIEGEEVEPLIQSLNIDSSRYRELKLNIERKLNSQKLLKEIFK